MNYPASTDAMSESRIKFVKILLSREEGKDELFNLAAGYRKKPHRNAMFILAARRLCVTPLAAGMKYISRLAAGD